MNKIKTEDLLNNLAKDFFEVWLKYPGEKAKQDNMLNGTLQARNITKQNVSDFYDNLVDEFLKQIAETADIHVEEIVEDDSDADDTNTTELLLEKDNETEESHSIKPQEGTEMDSRTESMPFDDKDNTKKFVKERQAEQAEAKKENEAKRIAYRQEKNEVRMTKRREQLLKKILVGAAEINQMAVDSAKEITKELLDEVNDVMGVSNEDFNTDMAALGEIAGDYYEEVLKPIIEGILNDLKAAFSAFPGAKKICGFIRSVQRKYVKVVTGLLKMISKATEKTRNQIDKICQRCAKRLAMIAISALSLSIDEVKKQINKELVNVITTVSALIGDLDDLIFEWITNAAQKYIIEFSKMLADLALNLLKEKIKWAMDKVKKYKEIAEAYVATALVKAVGKMMSLMGCKMAGAYAKAIPWPNEAKMETEMVTVEAGGTS